MKNTKNKKQNKVKVGRIANLKRRLYVSDQIREAMEAGLPRTKSQAIAMKATKAEPGEGVARVLRSLVSRGHISDMGSRQLLRPFRVCRGIYVNAYAAQVSTVGGGFAYNLQLDQLPGFADFTALFDQYRFTKMKYKLIPRINTNNLAVAAAVTTTAMPTIHTVSDPDDSTAPSDVDELMQYEGVKVNRMDDVKGSFKPRAAIAAYGGAFTAFADFDGWCDCASDDIQWYALKNWVTPGGASQTTFQVWDAHFEVECEFRFLH